MRHNCARHISPKMLQIFIFKKQFLWKVLTKQFLDIFYPKIWTRFNSALRAPGPRFGAKNAERSQYLHIFVNEKIADNDWENAKIKYLWAYKLILMIGKMIRIVSLVKVCMFVHTSKCIYTTLDQLLWTLQKYQNKQNLPMNSPIKSVLPILHF